MELQKIILYILQIILFLPDNSENSFKFNLYHWYLCRYSVTVFRLYCIVNHTFALTKYMANLVWCKNSKTCEILLNSQYCLVLNLIMTLQLSYLTEPLHILFYAKGYIIMEFTAKGYKKNSNTKFNSQPVWHTDKINYILQFL